MSWRKKIIQLSMLAGWDVAREVAKNTQQKLEVDTKDILSSNIEYLKRMYSLWWWITLWIIIRMIKHLYRVAKQAKPRHAFSRLANKDALEPTESVEVPILRTKPRAIIS